MVEIDMKSPHYLHAAKSWMADGHNVGVISESGMPSIADPGSEIIKYAHQNNYKVKPLSGPSSIFLALAASGMNGQNFCFRGYLPIKDAQLKKELNSLISIIKKTRQSQVFIETPYRNDRLFKFIKSTVDRKLMLCIAKDITGDFELIKTKSIADWKSDKEFSIGKYPCIFILGH